MAGRTIAEAATERETLTRDPLMWHGTIVTQDRLCSEMLATFRMSRAKSGLSTNGPTPVIPAALIFVSTGFIPLGVGISNLLMIGPPGAGKSLLASCLPGILPPLSPSEALEVSMVQSVAGTLEEGRISRARPFRAPHHSASMAALTGGGLRVKPGEVSLAYLGVLFLDELPEFQRAVLDSLRQPLETGKVDVARANAHVSFPANVQLVAAMNPCRCGHLGDAALACSRAPRCAADYQSKVSGPMLDRIDLHVEVDPVSAADLALPPPAEGSAQVAARVSQARERQTARFDATKARTNADLEGDALERFATPDEAGRQLLMQAATAMRLSARSYTRMLHVCTVTQKRANGSKCHCPPRFTPASPRWNSRKATASKGNWKLVRRCVNGITGKPIVPVRSWTRAVLHFTA